jgi:DNA-binding NarL/FixJ family response regulator
MTMAAVRVVVADDHPVFRRGLGMLLASVSDIEVVGEAATGTDVVAAAAGTAPDVVVMDLHMPGMDGIEATRRVRQACPQTAVLVLTMVEEDAAVLAAMRAGALGYLVKDADQDEIVRGIHAVVRGEVILGPPVARQLIEYLSAAPPIPRPPTFPELTAREHEVLGLIAQGQSNQEIAAQLELSLKTVRNHVSSIFNKLQVADRARAIVRAREAGLGLGPEAPA